VFPTYTLTWYCKIARGFGKNLFSSWLFWHRIIIIIEMVQKSKCKPQFHPILDFSKHKVDFANYKWKYWIFLSCSLNLGYCLEAVRIRACTENFYVSLFSAFLV
jgi:hypothetical protein